MKHKSGGGPNHLSKLTAFVSIIGITGKKEMHLPVNLVQPITKDISLEMVVLT